MLGKSRISGKLSAARRRREQPLSDSGAAGSSVAASASVVSLESDASIGGKPITDGRLSPMGIGSPRQVSVFVPVGPGSPLPPDITTCADVEEIVPIGEVKDDSVMPFRMAKQLDLLDMDTAFVGSGAPPLPQGDVHAVMARQLDRNSVLLAYNDGSVQILALDDLVFTDRLSHQKRKPQVVHKTSVQ